MLKWCILGWPSLQPARSTDYLAHPRPHAGSRNRVTDLGPLSWDCPLASQLFLSLLLLPSAGFKTKAVLQ